MYVWNIRALKAQLVAGPLPQSAAFQYAAVYTTLSAVAMIPGLGANRWDLFAYLATIVGALLGTWYCYRANGGAQGDRFLDRYLSIGFVAVIRLLPVLLTLAISVIAVEAILGAVPEETSFSEAAVGVFSVLIAYWRVGSHIRDVAQQTPTVGPKTT